MTDTSLREKIPHIIGACMCDTGNKDCYFWTHDTETHEGSLAQVDAIQKIIDEEVRKGRLAELSNLTQHFSTDGEDRFIDQDLYIWIWETRYPQLTGEHHDAKALQAPQEGGEK